MRFIHLADLHLGRSLAEFSLIELQREFLEGIIAAVREHGVDAVVIAGDVYDRSTPSVQAVQLLNGFLSALARLGVQVLMIAGNHDSAERLGFLNGVLDAAGIHIAGEYLLGAPPVTLYDEHGPVHFHLLPFFRPGVIRAQAPDERVETYDDAVRVAVEHLKLDASARNVLLAHQFVCAGGNLPMQSESEMMNVGTLDLVDARHFADFDYVALGHLHQAQRVGRETVRYAGAPLKYALGEDRSAKKYVLVDMGKKGEITVRQVDIQHSIDLRRVRGRLEEVMLLPPSEDFLVVELTDEEAVYDAIQTLRTRFPHVVSVRRDRDMMQGTAALLSMADIRRTDPVALFERFCEEITGYALTEEERADVVEAVRQAREEDET